MRRRRAAPAHHVASHGLATAVLACLAVAGVACAPTHATGSRVLLVGDSIMNGSRQEVIAALRDRGWDPIVHADGGTTITDWAPKVGFYDAVDQPDIVVFELGTNDCSPVECVPLAPYIDEIMRSIPSSRPVLWLNVQEDVPPPINQNVDFVNRALEEAAVRWPNLSIVDFSAFFAGHPEWHGNDGLHPSPLGVQELARFIADQLEPFKPQA